ncbi:hypothetical protein BX600DRAFT_468083 [Xylariales sp. PMI_506]|nr:hypothetical protein BX600DRAFT_468083 [Xylariales sp. PMI_506]
MTQNSECSRAREYFQKTPWCAALLAQPGVRLFAPSSRTVERHLVGGRSSQDQLFRTILHKPDAIPECIGLCHIASDSGAELIDPNSTVDKASVGTRLPVQSASLLLDLQPGVNGFSGTAHGGIIAAIVDEAMGNYFIINNEVQHQQKMRGPIHPTMVDIETRGVFVTASIGIKLKRPIVTPEIVLVKVTLDRIEGKKMFLQVSVQGENEVEYASGEGLWISLPLKQNL